MKTERNRNKAIAIVREQLAHLRNEVARHQATISALELTERALVEAYARKPARTPRVKVAPKPRTTNSDLTELATGVVQ